MSFKLRQTHSEEKALQDKGYKLLSKIGEGGYAKVCLGEFRPSDRNKPVQLACKIIDPTNMAKKFVTKFLPRELQILVKVNHPHIIQIHSIFHRKSKLFVFMRYCEKGDVFDYITENGAIREDLCRIWARQIALAIQYLHILEIAHRDLKCENVLVTINNNVKLADFGFARYVVNNYHRRELSETFCGSISYVAPEILKGEPYDPKIADLWSFGSMLYTMLNGCHPFEVRNTKLLYQNQIQNKWRFHSRFEEIISEEAKKIITNLLDPVVKNRYKIEQVINSNWIAKDPKLRTLTTYEFSALNAAMEEAQSSGRSNGPYEGSRNRILSAVRKGNSNRNSITFFKEYDGGFDLDLIRSELTKGVRNAAKEMSS